MSMRPGDRFGRYVVRALGRGGMGEVFRAYDRRLDREVALKLIAADLETRPQFPACCTCDERDFPFSVIEYSFLGSTRVA